MTDAAERKPWSELSPVTQAALRCKEPVFWAFLRENGYTTKNIEDEERAAVVVRNVCEITSRSELAEPSIAQAIWHDMDNSFQAWKARER
jgi:predicted nicotinamide N-methyase